LGSAHSFLFTESFHLLTKTVPYAPFGARTAFIGAGTRAMGIMETNVGSILVYRPPIADHMRRGRTRLPGTDSGRFLKKVLALRFPRSVC